MTRVGSFEYPSLYKYEHVTPVPKVHPPKLVKELRKISGTLNFSLITEKVISKFMNVDMKPSRDPSQYDSVQEASFYGILAFNCTVIKNNINIVDLKL